MGCHLTDQERQARLTTRDAGYAVAAYVEKARSALYASESDSKPLGTLEAYSLAARSDSCAARVWVDRLASVTQHQIETIFDRVPPRLISRSATQFAVVMLACNQRRLLEMPMEST